MANSPPSPEAHLHLDLHRRLLEQDETASAELAQRFLASLIGWLTERNSRIHADLIEEAAGDAILALIRNPQSYQPQRGGLEAYLRMSAQGDLRNILQREARHHDQRISWSAVELFDQAGKYLGRDDDPSLSLRLEEERTEQMAQIPDEVLVDLCETDRRVVELLLAGERKTAAYAEVMGIATLPLEDQRRCVKRTKDRLQKRIVRAEGAS